MTPDDTALATGNQFGILPASPKVETTTIGINKDGQFYCYGDVASKPGPVVPSIGTPRILDVQIVTRGNESRFGSRDYLELRLAGETPSRHYLLRLPCSGGRTHDGGFTVQHTCRSLLGALCVLDLPATACKIEPVRGRETTFIHVSLDPEGQQRVNAPSIGPSRADLEIAVDRCRVSLGLPPQFHPSHDRSPDPRRHQLGEPQQPAGLELQDPAQLADPKPGLRAGR